MRAGSRALPGRDRRHVGQIEAGLSLGAEPAVTVAPYLQSAVYASLLPRLDMLKSLGLVWIPGVMAGMMISGASPVYAAVYTIRGRCHDPGCVRYCRSRRHRLHAVPRVFLSGAVGASADRNVNTDQGCALEALVRPVICRI